MTDVANGGCARLLAGWALAMRWTNSEGSYASAICSWCPQEAPLVHCFLKSLDLPLDTTAKNCCSLVSRFTGGNPFEPEDMLIVGSNRNFARSHADTNSQST